MGETWLPSPCAARPTLEWAELGAICPERRTDAAIHHAGNEYRGHERVPGRNEPARFSRCDRIAGAGWRRLAQLPATQSTNNIALLPLPPYSPELNPVENVWEFLRGNWLSHRVWDTYEAILDACQDAWNKLMQSPERIASLTSRLWAKPVTELAMVL